MSEALTQVYDLARDREYVERVQMASVQASEYALAKEHGLFGSQAWWDAVADGSLPKHVVEGRITRVYVNQANWPEFEIERDGELSTWALEGEASRYTAGKLARIEYVMQRYASPAPGSDPETQVVIGIWVEPDL